MTPTGVQLGLHNISSFVIKTCFSSAPDAFWVAATHWASAVGEFEVFQWYTVAIIHLTPKQSSDLTLTPGLNNWMHKKRSSTEDVNRLFVTARSETGREGDKLIFDWLFSATTVILMWCWGPKVSYFCWGVPGLSISSCKNTKFCIRIFRHAILNLTLASRC